MARIVSTGVYLPRKIVKNEDFETGVVVDSVPISNYMTGMKERRHASPDETGIYMGTQAAKQCLERSGYSVDDIDMVMGIVCPNEHLAPEDINLIARDLGCKNAVVLPVNTTCSTVLTCLNLARILISEGGKKVIMIVSSANTVNHGMDHSKDYSMIGDGAGAILLDGKGDGFLGVEERANLSVFYTMFVRSPLFTNKPEYFVIKEDPDIKMVEDQIIKPVDVAKDLVARTGVEPDWFIAHQAGISMLEVWRKQLNIERRKLKHTFDKYANMHSANIAVTLDCYINTGEIKRGDVLLLFAPAAGGHYISILWRY